MLDGEKAGLEKEYFLRTAFADMIELPTTTAEAKKGRKSTERQTGYLTEPYHFEGYAWFLRELVIPAEKQTEKIRFFFTMERTRKSSVWVDGGFIGSFDSFYVAHRYEPKPTSDAGAHIRNANDDHTFTRILPTRPCTFFSSS